MTEPDDKLLRRYRALGGEEPPSALDDAILAASRRAVAKPSFSRRFAAPVSVAALLVLAFGVTLEMQREEPGVEYGIPANHEPVSKPAPPAPEASQAAPAPEAAPAVPPARDESRIERKKTLPTARDAQPFPDAAAPAPQSLQRQEPAPASPAAVTSAPEPASAPAAAPPLIAPSGTLAAPRAKAERADALGAPARALSRLADPQAELDRIAKMRDEGRDDEADEALDEFKRNYPEFRIPDATWSRVKPR
ncbi:MAG: hypothetical protein ABI789_05645 [Usitatibacter sp.]